MERQRPYPVDFEVELKKILAEDIEKNKGLPCPRKFAEIIANIEVKRGKKRLKTMGKKALIACCIFGLISTGLYLCFPEKVGEAKKRLINTVNYLFVESQNY